MSNRRRPRRLNLEGLDFALAQAFRSACDECGSSDLYWFMGSEAESLLGRESALSMAGWLNPLEAEHAHWWKCLTCGNAGVFGGVEYWH